MRVAVCTHVFPRAPEDPSAPFLLTWARALQAAGASVSVVAPHAAGLPAGRDVGGVPVRFARYAPARWELLAYRGEMHLVARRPIGPPLVAGLVSALARSLRAAVRRDGVDLVQVHWWLPGALAARVARVGVPVVVTMHGTDVALLEGRPRLAAVARWALARVDRLEAVSTDLAERFERATGRAVDAINPMPMAPDRLAPLPERPAPAPGAPLVVLGIGRLVPEKGFADLVDAVARLDVPARVVLVGEGPERERLGARAAAAGVALELAGHVDPATLRGWYAAADVVAQPSHREGLGLVAAEAVVAGVPVVATDSGGVRDVLPADLLVPVGDVSALAARLAAVAADLPAARAAVAGAADDLRERLSPAAAAARSLAGYAEVLRRR